MYGWQEVAEMQREHDERMANDRRAQAKRDLRDAYISVGLAMYCLAELGPLYALLNPDPAVYPLAREGADKLQARALEFIAEQFKGK